LYNLVASSFSEKNILPLKERPGSEPQLWTKVDKQFKTQQPDARQP
jgi:hypothetical protein